MRCHHDVTGGCCSSVRVRTKEVGQEVSNIGIAAEALLNASSLLLDREENRVRTHPCMSLREKYDVSVLCTRFGAAFLLLAGECWGVLSSCGYRGQVFSVVTIHIVNVGQDVKSDNTTLNLCSLTWPGINAAAALSEQNQRAFGLS